MRVPSTNWKHRAQVFASGGVPLCSDVDRFLMPSPAELDELALEAHRELVQSAAQSAAKLHGLERYPPP